MARDIIALGVLSTGTLTRAASISSEDLFNLPGRGVQLRKTDWFTFTLRSRANSLTIRSTGGTDMVGWLYRGTFTPTSDLSALGAITNNDDGGQNSNFQISQTNLAAGDYTIAVQMFNTGSTSYGLQIVADILPITNRDAALTVTSGLPTASLAAEQVMAAVPARPARPIVSAASLTSLAVSWSAPDDGGSAITDYDVQYRLGSRGPWTPWPFVGAGTSTTITGITGLTGGARYQVQVRAENRIGESSYSPAASPAPTAPAAPAAPTVNVVSSSSLTVSWSAPDDGGSVITEYDVQYRREGSSGPWTPWPFSGAGTSTTITALTADTSYEVRVRAENRIGESAWSLPGAAGTERILALLRLEIDWGNDGTFSHPAADVTGDMVKNSIRTTRGRTLQSRRKATAGRLECKLWNRNAKYDPTNPASLIHEKDITGVRVRVKLGGLGRMGWHSGHTPIPQPARPAAGHHRARAVIDPQAVCIGGWADRSRAAARLQSWWARQSES